MYRSAALLAVGLLVLSCSPARASDNEERLKPINLEKLNSPKDEDDPFLSSNSGALYYTLKDKGRYQVMMSVKRGAKLWPAGKPVPDLEGKADFCGPFLTAEGKYPQYFFFATNKDPLKKNKGDNYDIYFLIKQGPGADFTTETALRICTERDEKHPCLAGDGRTLYFSRKDKDGWRLYVTQRPGGGGQFNDEKQVGFPVGFHHATLSPDSKTMYLQGPLEKDRWGLFRSKYDGKAWSDPEPLTALNDPDAPTGDRSPSLSRDGSLLYFVSDRDGGKGGLDIWVIQTSLLNKRK